MAYFRVLEVLYFSSFLVIAWSYWRKWIQMHESEHSYSDEESADDDWVHPMLMLRKRNSGNGKGGRSGSDSRSLVENDGVDSLKKEQDPVVDTTVSNSSLKENQTTTTTVCCSCSRQSFCKTMKCECRASGGNCSASCGCSSKKCSNREGGVPDEAAEHSCDLASQGATLLQSALAERRPAEQHEEGNDAAKRKPLADIGNTAVCCFLTTISFPYNRPDHHEPDPKNSGFWAECLDLFDGPGPV